MTKLNLDIKNKKITNEMKQKNIKCENKLKKIHFEGVANNPPNVMPRPSTASNQHVPPSGWFNGPY
jgi:hypothetical protein